MNMLVDKLITIKTKTIEEFINIIIERTLKSYKETLEHEIEYIDYSLIKTEYDI